jgi:diguanylate cyclase (GGDEF)-like protein/PAS domain S-box-containing protein
MSSAIRTKRPIVIVSAIALSVVLTAILIWVWPETVTDLFRGPYMPHGYCFLWNKQLITLHVGSDTLIWISYSMIAITLTSIAYENKRVIPFRGMFLAFGAFIVACGFTHLMAIIVLWRPLYWMEGDIKFITAVASVATACLLPPLAPQIRKMIHDAEISTSAQVQREQAHAFTRSIIDSSSFAIIVTDQSGSITEVNPAAERLLWYTKKDLTGKKTILSFYEPQELIVRADELSIALQSEISPGIDVLTKKASTGMVEEGEWTFIRRDGSQVPVHVAVTALHGNEGVRGYIFTAFDITERIRSQEYIRHLATHDPLTGLPTRVLFRDRLDVALARSGRFNEKVALLMIDLDNFKRINDSLGHQAGDDVLVTISQRLANGVRATDTVARMGGDEFVAILCDLSDPKAAERIATNLLAALSAPIAIGPHEIFVTASMGLCAETHNIDAVSMLKNADVALYQSKATGKNKVFTYSPDMVHATVERLQLESQLRAALDRDELLLHFQPQVSLKNHHFTGVEVLLRWLPKGRELVLPQHFISLAEETGLIVPIGEWVIQAACQAGVRLAEKMKRDIIVAVNISPRQFQDKGVYRAVENALKMSGFSPSNLELEITEGVLMHDSEEISQMLQHFRDLGVRIALDDFGTGFSSMSYITRFAIDRIKIDQSFIRNVITDHNSRAVTTAIIAMARGLGIQVLAEGVETKEQRDFLAEQGCNDAQGHYFFRPMEEDNLNTVLDQDL